MNDLASGHGRRFTTPILWAAAAIVVFVLSAHPPSNPIYGGESQDTYYVVAHRHYVMSIAVAFVVFAAIYLALDVLPGISYRRRLGHLHLALTLIGTLLIMAPRIGLNLAAVPGRHVDPETTFIFWNAISVAGYGMTLIGLAVFVVLLVEAIIRRRSSRR